MPEVFTDKLKDRLILAGLKELEEHGIKDFSLRRVATNAEVSCAAPYRHFKDKEQLIDAIIEYVKEGWMVLCAQINEVFSDNLANKIKELCASGVRFWIANGNFRSVLMVSQTNDNELSRKQIIADFDYPILTAIDEYAQKKGLSDSERDLLKHTAPALMYGTIMLIAGGFIERESAIKNLKDKLDADLK
jgi:AcrR family transcriptional regulator